MAWNYRMVSTDLFDNVSDFGLPGDLHLEQAVQFWQAKFDRKGLDGSIQRIPTMMECRMVGKFGLHDGTLLMMNGH